jgi:2,3-bisphosphoglycerate-dependent phosphoglycerate mutase
MHDSSVTRFLFVRHGQTIWNAERRYAGSSEVELAPGAKEQIEALSKLLSKERIDAIYSSPLSRCLKTVAPTAHARHLRVIVREELRERSLGEWEGRSADEIHPPHEGYHFPESAYDGTFRIPGAERLDTLAHRVRSFLHEARDAHPGQTILVATHAGVIWAIEAHIVGNPPRPVRWTPNGTIVRMRAEGSHFILE